MAECLGCTAKAHRGAEYCDTCDALLCSIADSWAEAVDPDRAPKVDYWRAWVGATLIAHVDDDD